MRALIVLFTIMVIWGMTPAPADARDRDRHDRHYGKDRDHYVYKAEKNRGYGNPDHRRENVSKKHRHSKHDKHWRKHRHERHDVYRPYPKRVVYRAVPTRVVYREPVVYYYPSSYLSVGVPNLSFRVSW